MNRCRFLVPDQGGEALSLVQMESGRPLCTLMEDVDLHNIRNYPLRHDDVILCSYPRAGTHWTWELMRMLVNDRTDNDPTEKEAAMFEYRSHGELDSLPSPRIINTHLWFEELPAKVMSKRTKLVLVFRHPKDVAVSFYNLHCNGPWYQYQGKFEHWLPLFMEGKVDWGSYAEYLKTWDRVLTLHPDLPVHLVSYERLIENPTEEIRQLSRFLGKNHDDSFLEAVQDACAIDKMRERKKENYAGRYLPDDGAYFTYRKGISGGWTEWFTDSMSEEFDRRWSQVMDGSSLFTFH
ncbi:hypothetical protein ACOMHN_013398 [Nucella lapillus]